MSTPNIDFVGILPQTLGFIPTENLTSAQFGQFLPEIRNLSATEYRLPAGVWDVQLVWNGPETVDLNILFDGQNYGNGDTVPSGTGERKTTMQQVVVKEGEKVTLRTYIRLPRSSSPSATPEVRGSIRCIPLLAPNALTF